VSLDDDKNAFLATLKAEWVPLGGADGFSFSKWRGRRIRDHFLDCFSLQVKGDGTGCCLNVGLHLDFMPGAADDGPLDPHKIEPLDCEIQGRLSPGGLVGWWSLGDGKRSAEANARHLIHTYSTEGIAFFTKYSALPGIFGTITVDLLAKNEFGSILPLTRARAALFLGRLYLWLGDRGRAMDFARWGLENLGKGVTGPKKALLQILESKH
jgi:hypothetical protein